MKKSKIIIPALAMLVMSTAATVTGTVAWFTVNKTVTAKGMTVKAKADSSLVIKGSEDQKYTSVGTNNVSSDSMKPCTSYDGKNFGKLADNVLVESAGSSVATWTGAEGAFAAANLEVASNGENTYFLNSTYSIKSLGEAKAVYVKQINLNGTDALQPCIRVALTLESTTLVFNPGGGTNAAEGVGKYESGTWSLAVPTYTTVNTAGAKLAELPKDTAKNVTVTIWFEGQDTVCYSDNAINPADTTVDVLFTTEI